MSVNLRSTVIRVHRWVGLTVGLLAVYLAVTGGWIVLRPLLDPVTYPQLMVIPSCAKPLPIDALANAARASHPGGRLSYVYLYGSPTASAMVRFSDADQVYVDTCSGRVLGHQARYGGWYGTAESLHKFRFLPADTAMLILGTTAIVLASLLVGGGLFAWWPRRRATWRPALTARAFVLKLHTTIGVCASVVIFVVALTAVPLSLGWAKSALFIVTRTTDMTEDGHRPVAVPREASAPAKPITMQAAWTEARGLVRGPLLWGSVHYPAKNQSIEIGIVEKAVPHADARNYVYIDSHTGKVVEFRPWATLNAGSKLYYWALALHTGRAGGVLVQIVMLVGMIAVAILAYTGVDSAVRKKRRRSRDAARDATQSFFPLKGEHMSKSLCIALLSACAVLASGMPAFADSPAAPAISAKDGVQSTEGLDMQSARAKMMTARGRTVAYTRKWDISGIPHYVPKSKVTGTIRVWGSNYITDGMLGGFWETAFQKYHPGVKFQWRMKTTLAAVPALVFGVSDLGIGRKITFSELEMFQRYTDRDPIEITTATGSYDVPGWNPGFGIVVHKDNPIAHLTLAQLDGIFGAERSGGWEGTSWRPQWARGPQANIRTWGQLGLTGEWANKPIHVYGLNLRYHQAIEMSDKLLKSSDKWNEHLRIYANYVSNKGKLERGLNEDLAKDPLGIAYIAAPTTSLGRDTTQPTFKILPIAANEGGPYVPYTIETVHDRTYPLIDEIYMYADRASGQSMDPKVLEFMRFVVSQEGQAEVMRDGKYLPLTADAAREQQAKLDALGK